MQHQYFLSCVVFWKCNGFKSAGLEWDKIVYSKASLVSCLKQLLPCSFDESEELNWDLLGCADLSGCYWSHRLEAELGKMSSERSGYCLRCPALWICGGPFKKPEAAASVSGVFPFLSGQGISEINVLKIRDMFMMTSRVAENKSCRIFIFKINAVKFIKRLVE